VLSHRSEWCKRNLLSTDFFSAMCGFSGLSAAELRPGLLTPRTFPLSMQINVALGCYLLSPLRERREKNLQSAEIFSPACGMSGSFRLGVVEPVGSTKASRDKGQQRSWIDLLHAVEQGTIVHKGYLQGLK
jgi:hypothetical protein